MNFPEGNAIIYCEGAYGTTTGKTAHGLVRRTARYRVLSVVDSSLAGKDAGQVIDGKANGIPIFASVRDAVTVAKASGESPTHFVIGLAPDAGKLRDLDRAAVIEALQLGLNVDSGLHHFLSDIPEVVELATARGLRLRDVRKTPPRSQLHGFTGKISQVEALKVAILGTDSAVGKRTTAWCVVDALRRDGYRAEMVGTGQTAWLQGARHGILLDSLINDFVAGELEHAVWSSWNELKPEVIVIEGQGSLMNPAYPGGLEILAAARPEVIVLQHAPARKEYGGFPGFPMHTIEQQIKALELVSSKPVVAVTVNHEDLAPDEIPIVCAELSRRLGLPVVDVLIDGAGAVARALSPWLKRFPGGR